MTATKTHFWTGLEQVTQSKFWARVLSSAELLNLSSPSPPPPPLPWGVGVGVVGDWGKRWARSRAGGGFRYSYRGYIGMCCCFRAL